MATTATNTTKDLYAVLGVLPQASPELIKAAYRTATKTKHPDMGGDPAAFREITEAYEVLDDPVRRNAYDQERAQYLVAQEAAARQTEAPRTRSASNTTGSGNERQARVLVYERSGALVGETPLSHDATYDVVRSPGLFARQRWIPTGRSQQFMALAATWGVVTWGVAAIFWFTLPAMVVGLLPPVTPHMHLPVWVVIPLAALGAIRAMRQWDVWATYAEPVRVGFAIGMPLALTIGAYLAVGWILIAGVLGVAMVAAVVGLWVLGSVWRSFTGHHQPRY